MSTRKRVLIVDDHPLVRHGLCQAIASTADMVVCGQEGSWHKALEIVLTTRPDLIVLDLNLEDGNGWSLLEQLQARGEQWPVLVFSVCDEQVYAKRLLKAGARGYMMKASPITCVLAAMRKVLAGQIALSETMNTRLLEGEMHNRPANSTMDQLSDRELQVYEMIGEGLSNKDIGFNLGVSHKTIGTYKARLMQKLSCRTTQELMLHVGQLHQGETPAFSPATSAATSKSMS